MDTALVAAVFVAAFVGAGVGFLLRGLVANQEADDHARNEGGHDDSGHKGDFHIHLPPTRSNEGPEVRRNI